jgi:hydrogenase/urease accessory protein HupE
MRPKKYPQERALTAVGCVGAVLIPIGSMLYFGGGGIVLPLWGVEVPGSVVLIAGSLLMLGAIVADKRLSNRKTREQVILETLGAEEEDR